MAKNKKIEAYQALEKTFDQISNLGGIGEILNRDMQTVMPSGSEEDRVHQMVILEGLSHDLIADPKIADLLDEAESHKDALDPEQQVNLVEMRRQHTHEASIPQGLAETWSKQNIEGERLHLKERSGGDWNAILPFFRESIKLAREIGDTKKDVLGLSSTYDALLDEWGPGWTTKDLDSVFAQLEPFVKKLLPDVMNKQAQEAVPLVPQGPFEEEAIKALCTEFCTALALDFDKARIDFIDDHPSSGGTADDIRITGRVDTDGFLLPLYDLLHEAGHGLYDQGTPPKWRYQPAGESMGMDIHESQSLIMEFQLGKSKEFSRFLSGRAQDIFNRQSEPAFSADNLNALLTRVKASPVRIDLDTSEVTYPLHILLRYKLERDMISGALDPADLPEAWDKEMSDIFGIKPESNTEGCMQDVHWFCGYWGYFPTYNLGAMAAAQIFDAANRENPDLMNQIERGEFTDLREWLRDKVHSKGSLLSAPDLIKQATGSPLDAKYLMDHLSTRYLNKPLVP